MAKIFLKLTTILVMLPMATILSSCSNMLFYPSKVMVRTPADVGIRYQDIDFHSKDGTLLHGWYLPANGDAKGSILFVHGNAENISTHLRSVYWLPAKGYNVLLFDYRGYGLSGGTPSLDGAISDCEAALKTLVERVNKNGPQGLIVFGQSLGGALAIYATETSQYKDSVNAVVVESTFASYRDIAQDKFAHFILTWPLQWPLALLFPDDLSPVKVVKGLAPIPLLVIHGDADPIVPIQHGKALYDAANEPKQFWKIAGGGHISAFNSEKNRERFLAYIAKHLPH